MKALSARLDKKVADIHFVFSDYGGEQQPEREMRLIQNMTTIAEYPAPESSVPCRAIKMAVIGGSGVGKTGKKPSTDLMERVYFFLCWLIEQLSHVVAFLCFSAGSEIPNEAIHRRLREKCW